MTALVAIADVLLVAVVVICWLGFRAVVDELQELTYATLRHGKRPRHLRPPLARRAVLAARAFLARRRTSPPTP